MGCQSNPEIQYETRYIKPPAQYLTNCPREYKDNTIREIIIGMDSTIRCYEDKQSGIIRWTESLNQDKEEK